jgi:hypothetical protein
MGVGMGVVVGGGARGAAGVGVGASGCVGGEIGATHALD